MRTNYHTVHREAYTALEALRLSVEFFDDMIDGEPPETDDMGTNSLHEQLPMLQSAVRLVTLALQEKVFAASLAVPDRVFLAIRCHENTFARNAPGTERIMLAMNLGKNCLNRAIDAIHEDDLEEAGELYDLCLGSFEVTHMYLSFIESCSVFGTEEALAEVLAGRAAAPVVVRAKRIEKALREHAAGGAFP